MPPVQQGMVHRPHYIDLCGRAPYVLGPRPFGTLAEIELDAVTLAEVVESLAVHGALMEEVFLPAVVLDEPETLVHA